jgi:hypothetical protein
MGSFSFIDATSTDTPIFDSVARGQVFECAESFDISERYRKAVCFKLYLEAQWHAANITAPYFDFSALMKAQEDSFGLVKKFIDRDAPRRRR